MDMIQRMVKAGRADKEFLSAIKSANDDNPPGMFSSQVEKAVFAAGYYGYLVANHGDEWKLQLS